MTDPETRLARLWASDEPPARDPVFETEVALRVERRRWLSLALEAVALTIAALVVGWAAWPFVAADVVRLGPSLAVAAAVGLAIVSVDLTVGGAVLRGYEDFTRDFASD